MSSTSIWGAPTQVENPIVKCVRRAKITFDSDIGPYDFVPNVQLRIPVLFLSLKFHSAFKEYIGHRIQSIIALKSTSPPILILLMDMENEEGLERITSACVLNSVRLLLAWSAEEGARILEILHLFGPDRAGEIARGQFSSVVKGSELAGLARDSIVTLQGGVGPKDAANLLSHFGSLKAVILASEKQLTEIPLIGAKKSKHIFNQFNNI